MIIKLTKSHVFDEKNGYRKKTDREIFLNVSYVVEFYAPSMVDFTSITMSNGEKFGVKETPYEIQHLANGTQDFSKTPL